MDEVSNIYESKCSMLYQGRLDLVTLSGSEDSFILDRKTILEYPFSYAHK